MEVTAVKVNLLNTDNHVKAIGSFTLDKSFVVSGIRVMEKKEGGGEFVSFPAREKGNGEYEDVAFPVTKNMHKKITDAVIEEYNRIRNEEQNQSNEQEQEKNPFKEAEQAEEKKETSKKAKGR